MILEGFAQGLRWNVLSWPAHAALALLNSALLAHALGLRDFGNYAVLTSFYATLRLAGDLGLSGVVWKLGGELAARGRRFFALFFMGILALKLAAFVAVVLLSRLFIVPLSALFHLDYSAPQLFFAFALVAGLEDATSMLDAALTSLFEIKAVHLSQLFNKMIIALGLGCAALLGWGIGDVIIVMALAHVLQAALGALWLCRALSGMKPAAPTRPLPPGRVARLALANYWTKISNLVSSSQFMTLMLASFLPPAATGLFSFTCEFALRFVSGGLQPISNLLLPSFSASFVEGAQGGHRRVFHSAAAILAMVAIPSVSLAMALAQPLVWLLYPPEFWLGARLALVLIPLLGLAHFFLFLLGSLVIGYERYGHWTRSKLWMMVLLAGVVLLSRRLGVNAAAIGYGAVLALVNLCLYRSLKGEFDLQLPRGVILKLTASAAVYAALALAGVHILGSGRPAAGFTLALLLALVFPAALRAAGGLSPAEKDILRDTGVPEPALRWL